MQQKILRVVLPVIAGIMGLAACGGQFGGSPTPATNVTPAPAVPTPAAAAAAKQPSETTPVPVPAVTPEDTSLTLTLWTLEDVSSLAENEAAAGFLVSVIDTFERENSGIKVNVLVKKASGKGGVLDFLRTSRDVAPLVLPTWW